MAPQIFTITITNQSNLPITYLGTITPLTHQGTEHAGANVSASFRSPRRAARVIKTSGPSGLKCLVAFRVGSMSFVIRANMPTVFGSPSIKAAQFLGDRVDLYKENFGANYEKYGAWRARLCEGTEVVLMDLLEQEDYKIKLHIVKNPATTEASCHITVIKEMLQNNNSEKRQSTAPPQEEYPSEAAPEYPHDEDDEIIYNILEDDRMRREKKKD